MQTRRQPLEIEFLRSILHYDPATGVFHWKQREDRPRGWNSRWAGKVAGTLVHGHLVIQIARGRLYYAHVLAWAHFYGEWPSVGIDHINLGRTDNWIENLRLATDAENSRNRPIRSDNTSGFIGVSWAKRRRKWTARINVAGKLVWAKFFDTPEEAAKARAEVLHLYHGEFARVD